MTSEQLTRRNAMLGSTWSPECWMTSMQNGKKCLGQVYWCLFAGDSDSAGRVEWCVDVAGGVITGGKTVNVYQSRATAVGRQVVM